jgi:hypothetical protein
LSAQPGMHRFVWDMHYAKPNALSHGFPISAILHDTPQLPLGAFALPGNYTVKLRVGKGDPAHLDGFTVPLVVKMDPRIKASPADLAQQFAMESASVVAMNDTFQVLGQVASVRAQIKERLALEKQESVTSALTALDQRIAQLAGTAESGFNGLPPSGKQPENLSTAHQHFSTMLGVADSYDGAPTTQAIAAFRLLEDDTQRSLTSWKDLQDKDLAAVNEELIKSGVPPIDVHKPAAEAPSSDADGDDEP